MHYVIFRPSENCSKNRFNAKVSVGRFTLRIPNIQKIEGTVCLKKNRTCYDVIS